MAGSAIPRARHLLPVLALMACTACPPLRETSPNVPNGGRAVAIAVDPTNADDIIVASETGGLFQSTNRGVDWKQVSGGAPFDYADVLHVPANPSIVVAAAQGDMHVTSAGGMWRSTDGGATWARANVTPPSVPCTTDLSAFAVNVERSSGKLWAGTLCGLAYSVDQGATWQYLAPGSGYSNDKTYAVLAPTSTDMMILTGAGVKVSTDGGVSWTLSNSGLPGNILIGVHNQLAVSPLDDHHLYWAFNYWKLNTATGKWEGHIALYRSTDRGTTWSSVIDVVGINRPPFVKATKNSDATHYALYFGDGGCSLQRATVTNGALPVISAWTSLSFDHCDPADIGFDTDGWSPLLLATDGGLHKTSDGGASWAFTGGAGHGYAALQITEVTGQLDSAASGSDLYYGTQDNDLRASGDNGVTWSGSLCCEGFFINVWRGLLPAAQTKVTFVKCWQCFNFMSGPLFGGVTGFPNPTNSTGNPRLLKPSYYIESDTVTGLRGNIFSLTADNGGTWTPRYGFSEDVRALSEVANTPTDPVVFTAVRKPGSTPDGQEILGIKRIMGVIGAGAPVVSDVTGYGSFGIFPTMFAWYKPYGVDPQDPNYFIVPDIIDDVVKVSRDGGMTWVPDTVLTRLVTESGNLRFRSGPFTQISTFGYDPDCDGHVMVGTVQAGVFETFDRGATWSKVDRSELIPNVSRFFFAKPGDVVLSSYGRGLWRYRFTCPRRTISPMPPPQLAEPLIFWKGAYIPISQIHDPDACPVCTWFLMQHGEILDYAIGAQTGRIESVRISGGELRGLTWTGAAVQPPFSTSVGRERGTFGGDRELLDVLDRTKAQVKGLLMEGPLLKGVVLASADVDPGFITRRPAEGPRIQVNIASRGGVGVPVGSLGPIVINGRGFERGAPVEVLVDGQPVRPERQTQVDARGTFTVTITPQLGIGGHTILVRQKSSTGLRQDAFTFNVTVRDEMGQRER